ncbi:outer membrane beta-barrel protein [Undibacterium flavidum]|uniref:Outer membrane beta-barrel protein n=1 Tax=Undibacterium flavidum TaxID=2762297 RepID=A0ABR6Y7Z6_9BURK|nr:outer membrane beta-barrel protein [Undibacterium flavidum]MBC3872708.1 outer membrane beta-barrel protein [Undibacterium flavidum]
MLKKKLFASLMLVAGLVVGASASAQVYVAGTVGQAKWNADCNQSGASCDKTGNSYKVIGGYNLDKNFALEASYFSLGKMKATASSGGITGFAEAKGTGFELAGVVKRDFNDDFAGFAKLGLARVSVDTSANVPSIVKMASDTNSTQPVLGFGLTYKVSKEIALRGEVETRRVKIGDEKSSVNNFSVGVQYTF